MNDIIDKFHTKTTKKQHLDCAYIQNNRNGKLTRQIPNALFSSFILTVSMMPFKILNIIAV